MASDNLTTRLKNAWSVFVGKNNKNTFFGETYSANYGFSSSHRPDRWRLGVGSEKTIVNSIFNRIAMDVALIDIRHVRLDDEGRFIEFIHSGLDNCLSLEANIDQTGFSFIHDAVTSMLDEGCIALVPVDTTADPNLTKSYDILSMRVGKIVGWYPKHVRVLVYNDTTGKRQEVTVLKENVAIIENPLYSVINEPNSTLKRLMRKLSLLDIVDEQSSSGKLDLIIQLPYIVKSDARMEQAEKRRKQIEDQLQGSKYGIAYTDGTEKITQLSRPLDNHLQTQVEYLTKLLYSQLGITESVMDGTADEKTMLNYNNRTLEPIVMAIVTEMKRKFLSKTARSQGQSIKMFKDPFRLVPVNQLAEIADKFTRNCIATSNEIRQVVGWKPVDDPQADQLINNNLNQPVTGIPEDQYYDQEQQYYDENSPEENQNIDQANDESVFDDETRKLAKQVLSEAISRYSGGA